MANPFQSAVSDFLKVADESDTSDAKGKAFEELTCFLVEQIPGVSVIARNALDYFGHSSLNTTTFRANPLQF